jgi:hypothetical protein
MVKEPQTPALQSTSKLMAVGFLVRALMMRRIVVSKMDA